MLKPAFSLLDNLHSPACGDSDFNYKARQIVIKHSKRNSSIDFLESEYRPSTHRERNKEGIQEDGEVERQHGQGEVPETSWSDSETVVAESDSETVVAESDSGTTKVTKTGQDRQATKRG